MKLQGCSIHLGTCQNSLRWLVYWAILLEFNCKLLSWIKEVRQKHQLMVTRWTASIALWNKSRNSTQLTSSGLCCGCLNGWNRKKNLVACVFSTNHIIACQHYIQIIFSWICNSYAAATHVGCSWPTGIFYTLIMQSNECNQNHLAQVMIIFDGLFQATELHDRYFLFFPCGEAL